MKDASCRVDLLSPDDTLGSFQDNHSSIFGELPVQRGWVEFLKRPITLWPFSGVVVGRTCLPSRHPTPAARKAAVGNPATTPKKDDLCCNRSIPNYLAKSSTQQNL